MAVEREMAHLTDLTGVDNPQMTTNGSLLSHGQMDASSRTDSFIDAVLILFYMLIVVLGTTGNAVVIWTARFRLPLTVANVWLVNLAVADLVFSLSRVLSLLQKLFFHQWPFGGALCKLNGMLKYANMFCSVFLLSIISIDRAMCVWWPVLAKRHRTLAVARLVSAGLWLLSITLSTPYFAHRQALPGTDNLTKCSMEPMGQEGPKLALYALRFLCGFLIPFLVILGCYSLAALGLRRTRLARRSKPLKILACLVTAFFLSWAPYHCFLLAKMVNGKNQTVKTGLNLAKVLAYLNSCMNPLLYFCMGLGQRRWSRPNLVGVCRRALEEEGEIPMGPTGERVLEQSLAPPNQAGVLRGTLDVNMTRV
ncbi:hypothetical protein AAFF_G00329020 [Aldrovandia affinis]|uniref:G-protein coupled receptors family 1 profile domain-containing protein n=1 Tax=Aldrovandia affinis TaxID=143900 RepID=A0AAD7WPT7_9TELE|nr:hypothetical protein AAFF_G00329020 [Aldrovandia affinis]